jgi:hypothetical protein
LPDDEIVQLRQSIAWGHLEPHPYLRVGSRVRVTRGPLAGAEGVLVRKKGVLKIVLSVEAIMKSVAVEVSSSDVRPIEASKNIA